MIALFLSAFIATARADFLPASFSADYVEVTVSSATGKEQKANGKLDYKYPKQIRMQVTSPYQKTFVSNTTTTWHYDPPFIEGEVGQVRIQKSAQLAQTKLLDALKHGTQPNKFYAVSFERNQLVLTLNDPLKKDLGVNKVVLVGDGEASKAASLGDFKELILQQNSGKQTKLQFTSFRSGADFATDHFTFQVPPKTKVVGEK